MTTRESLDRLLAHRGMQDCPCPYEHQNLGKLYGISMGKGWVRTGTNPQCPHHAEAGSS